MKRIAGVLCLAVGVFCGDASAVSNGQVDTFQDGSTNGWSTGLGSPNPPVNVGSGGPAGAADKYLRLTASGSPGAGGRLVAIAGAEWYGDYVAAGITGIRMQVNNMGSTDLSLRLVFSDSFFQSAYSADAIAVKAASGWTTIQFSTLPGALSGPASVMSGVSDLRLYHSVAAGLPSGGAFIAASLGVNNIAAVPEPAEWAAMLAGLTLLAGVAARRRASAGH